jgi:3-oxoacyl-[acyl-carrier protein] reductase
MGKLTGKVALITGGNKGIGERIAHDLAAEGASLTLTAQGHQVLALPADMTDERQVQDMFAGTLERFALEGR